MDGSIVMSIVSVFVAILSLVTTIIANIVSAKLNNEARLLELRKLIIDANDSILSLGGADDDLIEEQRRVKIEKLLNAYEVICYLKRKKISKEWFVVLYGNEMIQVLEAKPIKEELYRDWRAYPYIKRALMVLRMSKPKNHCY